MSDNKAKLIKLTVQIGSITAELTRDEARDLYNALGELFQVKRETVYLDRYRDWSWPYPRPYWSTNLGGLGDMGGLMNNPNIYKCTDNAAIKLMAHTGEQHE